MGVNTRSNYIESFYVGVLDEKGTLHCIGKVSSGLSESKKKYLTNKLKPFYMVKKPSNAEFGNEKPYMYLNIKKSIILQIRASELVLSDSFKTPYTLRFPRIDSIRDDKEWDSCLKLSDFEHLYQSLSSVAKIHKRKTCDEDFSGKSFKVNKEKLMNPYQTVISHPTEVLSEKFADLNFCILSPTKNHTVSEAKEIVLKLSGRIIENPSSTLKCICIAGELTPKVKSLLNLRKYNIICFDWLLRQYNNPKTTIKISPKDLICSTSELTEQMKEYYDEFCDSFDDFISENELKEILININSNEEKVL